MTLGVFLAVIGAAFLHASWNALIKVGADKFATMVLMTAVQGSIGFIIAMQLPWPAAHVWPWLLASGFFHAFYKFFLIFAYERGDLSRVYPIARGAAPMIVLCLSPFLLSDTLNSTELIGILLLGLGILGMAGGAFTSGENFRLVPYALMSAAMTAGYSIVDGIGAREAGNATVYVAWLFTLDGLMLMPAAFYLRGPKVFRNPPKVWLQGSLAAVASYGAYAIAVWAMTQAPIALVAALRETSIFFAILLGWLVFSERFNRAKIFASVLIVAGMIGTRL